MMQKIKCALGFHKYKFVGVIPISLLKVYRCDSCWKSKIIESTESEKPVIKELMSVEK